MEPRTPVGSGKRWKIATFRGIPLYVSTSWVFIVVFFVWSQYAVVLIATTVDAGASRRHSSWRSSRRCCSSAACWCTKCAHAVMARSLDLPVMGITIGVLGRRHRNEGVGSGRGRGVPGGVRRAGQHLGHGGRLLGRRADDRTACASYVVGWLAWISLLFAGLNTLPAFPLDGGRMFLAAVWGITRQPADRDESGRLRRVWRSASRRPRCAVMSFQRGDAGTASSWGTSRSS